MIKINAITEVHFNVLGLSLSQIIKKALKRNIIFVGGISLEDLKKEYDNHHAQSSLKSSYKSCGHIISASHFSGGINGVDKLYSEAHKNGYFLFSVMEAINFILEYAPYQKVETSIHIAIFPSILNRKGVILCMSKCDQSHVYITLEDVRNRMFKPEDKFLFRKNK